MAGDILRVLQALKPDARDMKGEAVGQKFASPFSLPDEMTAAVAQESVFAHQGGRAVS
jgi:hypothetical protein